jgi:hypothetical protein
LVNYEFKFEQYDKKIEFDDIKAVMKWVLVARISTVIAVFFK